MKLSPKRKKGSLELSVNAIVVLVMAIAILGLGLAFIRNALTKAGENVMKPIDNLKLENPATPENPLTLDRNVLAKSGSSGELSIGYYNDKTTKVAVHALIDECINSLGNNTLNGTTKYADKIFVASGTMSIDSGSAQGFMATVRADKTVPSDKYLCVLNITNGTDTYRQGQFYLQVNN